MTTLAFSPTASSVSRRKKVLVLAWLLAPVALLAFHYGPGRMLAARDDIARHVTAAEAAAASNDWTRAVAEYNEAVGSVPKTEQALRARLVLAHADARIRSGELPEAISEMEDLLENLPEDKATEEVARQARSTLAEAQYYAGWLMRLECASTEEWTRETEGARQQFRLLAEQGLAGQTNPAGPTSLYQTNLEAVVRLAQMDISELQALPLPGKVCNCQNVSQKIRKQRASRMPGKGKGKGGEQEKEKDKDSRGAGTGQRPDETGS